MTTRGRFVWYELMAKDVDAARRFYPEVIGWKTKPWEGSDYIQWNAGDTGVGGLMALPDEAAKMGAPPHFMGYVSVENVTAACKQVEKLGGKVVKGASPIPEVGTFAVFTDPQGATLALFQPEDASMSAPANRGQGHISWHELNTTDYESAWKFYSELFGWKHTTDFEMGDMGMYFMFGEAGSKEAIGGMSNVAKQHEMPPHWLYYITVEDIDGAVERVKSHGGKVLNGPMEVPGGDRTAQCMDSQGAAFGLHWTKK